MVKPVQKKEYKNNAERLAAIKRLARSTNKKQGVVGVTMASDLETAKRAPFGIEDIDNKIGGGIPHGNISIVWGGPGSSKTTLALHLAAQAQKEGKLVAWAALETFDPDRADQIGVNRDEMPVLQFPKAEQVLDVMLQYAQENLVDVFIMDSIHSLSPKGQQENSKGQKSMEDNTIGVLARKLSEFFPRFMDPLKRSKMAVLLIGQTRMKIGFISIEGLTGGNALHHAGRLIINLRRGAKDDSPVHKVKVPTGEKDENGELVVDKKGNPKTKTEKTIIGFPAVFKLDKVQINDSLPEQSRFSVPFYFESGYELPQILKDEIAAEEAEIEAQMGVESTNEEKPTVDTPKAKKEPKRAVKRKRGRPKTTTK